MKKRVSVFITCLICLLSSHTSVYAADQVKLHSQYAYCYDRETSLVYIDQKSEERIYPASMTKILTVSLALNKISNLQQVVTITQDDLKGLTESHATVAGFYAGEQVTYNDLLYGALLPSGADACYALARLTYGSQEQMVTAMNEMAEQLKLQNSHFMNVTGLHDEQHYTTVKDMSSILNWALNHKEFVKIYESRTHKSSKGNHVWKSSLQRGKEEKNIDISHIDGGKSGFTDEAGLTFASTMTIDHHQLILVTAKAEGQYSQNHVQDAVTVYNDVNKKYHNVILYKKDEVIDSLWVLKSFQGIYPLCATQDLSILTEKTINKEDLDIHTDIKKVQTAPMQKGDEVAKITVEYKGNILYQYSYNLNENIESSMIASVIHYCIIVGIPAICLFFIIRRIMIKIHKTNKKRNKS